MDKVKIVTAADLVRMAKENDETWLIEHFEKNEFDGMYIDTLMSLKSVVEKLPNMVQVCMHLNSIIFIDKNVAIEAVKSNPEMYGTLLNDAAFRYVSAEINGVDMSKHIHPEDLPPLPFVSNIPDSVENGNIIWVSGVVNKMPHGNLFELQNEDYLDCFFATICEPVINAVEANSDITVDRRGGTYVALINYVLEEIMKTAEYLETESKVEDIVKSVAWAKERERLEIARTFKLGDPVIYGREKKFGFITNIGSICDVEAYSVDNGYTFISKTDIGRRKILEHWFPKNGEWCLFYKENNSAILCRFKRTEESQYVDEFDRVWEKCYPFKGTLPPEFK